MVTQQTPLPSDAGSNALPDAGVVVADEKNGKVFTGEEVWLLFATVKLKKTFKN